MATYRARVERGIVIHVEAYEWNCPQHIKPRYSEAELEGLLTPLHEEIRLLKAQALTAPKVPVSVLGEGPLELVITGMRQLTTRIRAFELRSPSGDEFTRFYRRRSSW